MRSWRNWFSSYLNLLSDLTSRHEGVQSLKVSGSRLPLGHGDPVP
ncbi:hypothetical protein HMPREF0620_0519 [Parascardovia denticolens DSM 10105 = JCM 12538]|uniref:Uncharacterized protein n=1 Tax=Parascardovia denticolens DSM 10105 = JCM 12538 TaxID=864564 RepID=E6K133_PARDN|nr:hypothetical protein HMPREF0620_0519 [Parascardovia denticolens DSM 10105 = JCM 12538]